MKNLLNFLSANLDILAIIFTLIFVVCYFIGINVPGIISEIFITIALIAILLAFIFLFLAIGLSE